METIRSIIEFELFHVGEYSLTMGKLITVGVTILIAILVLWLLRKTMLRKRSLDKFEKANYHSLFQIIRYLIWIIVVLFILEELGIKLNVLLAGSAALLVGVGLGLQNTFNNFISGIILLFEGSIKVGDVLEVDRTVVKVERIGLRTLSARNRDDIILIIPNSHVTSNTIINWSHQSEKTRFRIDVGVAYGSDVDLVIKVLKESALEHHEIDDKKSIFVRFTDFGNSSLNFELLFFSLNIFRIENIKSEIRIIINRKFIENRITIPFPQVDMHFKSDATGYFRADNAQKH